MKKTFSIPTKEPEKAHTPAQRQNHPVLDPARAGKAPLGIPAQNYPKKLDSKATPDSPQRK